MTGVALATLTVENLWIPDEVISTFQPVLVQDLHTFPTNWPNASAVIFAPGELRSTPRVQDMG